MPVPPVVVSRETLWGGVGWSPDEPCEADQLRFPILAPVHEELRSFVIENPVNPRTWEVGVIDIEPRIIHGEVVQHHVMGPHSLGVTHRHRVAGILCVAQGRPLCCPLYGVLQLVGQFLAQFRRKQPFRLPLVRQVHVVPADASRVAPPGVGFGDVSAQRAVGLSVPIEVTAVIRAFWIE